MSKIVVSEFLSLDGVMENPAWTFPYWNDDIARFKGEEQAASGALLLGRVTYEGFAAAWPQSQDPGADEMNAMPKFVVSGTLREAAWNNSAIIGENIFEEVARLRARPGGDLLVYGSGQLVRGLLQAGLVDQVNLLVYPVVVGGGKRLFEGGEAKLKLLDARAFGSGVVLLTYQPLNSATGG